MIISETHSNPSDETQYTIFMNYILRWWPSVEKIYYLFIYSIGYKKYLLKWALSVLHKATWSFNELTQNPTLALEGLRTPPPPYWYYLSGIVGTLNLQLEFQMTPLSLFVPGQQQ